MLRLLFDYVFPELDREIEIFDRLRKCGQLLYTKRCLCVGCNLYLKIGVTKVSIKLVKIPLNTGDKHSVGYYSHSVDKSTFIILMDLSIVIIYVEIINWS